MVIPLIKMMRPHQWLKNLMLFFPPFLGGTFFSRCVVPESLIPFFAFCVASSATYVVNDIFDHESDHHHPRKCCRPLAAGQISKTGALVLVMLLLAAALLLAIMVAKSFLMYLMLYIGISIAYSYGLKHIPLVDIFCISAGFLLRLLAGGSAFATPISEWLFLSVFLLAVFLSTGKRLAEKSLLGEESSNHRRSLSSYPEGFLDGTMYLTGSSVLVTYTMYVISRHSELLLYSVPLCCFGLLRYILRVQSGKGGDPTESLLRDVPLLIVGITWVFLVGWGIYGD